MNLLGILDMNKEIYDGGWLQQRFAPTNMSTSSLKCVQIIYLEEGKWNIYCEALLTLEPREPEGLDLVLTPTKEIPSDRLTVLPLALLQREAKGALRIGVELFGSMERMEDTILAFRIDEWNKVLGFSFRDDQYCDSISEQIELSLTANSQLPCKSDEFFQYISQELATSIHFIDWIFDNKTTANQFFTLLSEGNISKQEEKVIFNIIKMAFMRSSKSVFEIFLKQQYFVSVLRALSFNYEFGDRQTDYASVYLQQLHFQNILQFKQQHIIQLYRDIIKARFLIDYPTSMFIEINTQVVLGELIRQRTIRIIDVLNQRPQYLTRYKNLAIENPVLFIELFSQLWEMFKSVADQLSTIETKLKFHRFFMSQGLLYVSFQCLQKCIQIGVKPRLYQKFLESLNPFLSYSWIQSQKELLSISACKSPHLASLLLNILSIADYNTKVIVLTFIRYLVEPSQNRKTIRQAFHSYVFKQILAKIKQYLTSPKELELLIDLILRSHKVDCIRSRRLIIDEDIVGILQRQSNNKHIAISSLKLLRGLMTARDEDMFIYLTRRKAFIFLRKIYALSKKAKSRGILYSMLEGLTKDSLLCLNRQGLNYFYEIIFNEQKPQ